MCEFMIDSKGILWVRGEGEEGFACTGMLCREGEEEAVWSAIPNGEL